MKKSLALAAAISLCLASSALGGAAFAQELSLSVAPKLWIPVGNATLGGPGSAQLYLTSEGLDAALKCSLGDALALRLSCEYLKLELNGASLYVDLYSFLAGAEYRLDINKRYYAFAETELGAYYLVYNSVRGWGFSGELGLGMGRRLGEDWALFLEPSYTCSIAGIDALWMLSGIQLKAGIELTL